MLTQSLYLGQTIEHLRYNEYTMILRLNKMISLLLLLVFIFLCFPRDSFAIVNPLSFSNNRFGIHISSENDFDKASELVNSNGGDWGYVTFVIRQDEIHQKRWQTAFNKLRELHLIPIVRVATIQKEGVWEKPDVNDIDEWVSFFQSLNWVTQNRYVIIGNEVNHAKEWGGDIDPFAYADYYTEFYKQLKMVNNDYFVLPAALDNSAPNSKTTMSADIYLKKILEKQANFGDMLDGWNSHSYPNPGFSGDPSDTGRISIRSYQWELTILADLGIKKDLPIFITETGWIDGDKLDETKVADYMTQAFRNVWTDSHIVAITPFILNYSQEPFSSFSWIRSDHTNKKVFEAVKGLTKIRGIPLQKVSGELSTIFVPPLFKVSDTKIGVAVAKNTGQSIWYKDTTSYIEDGEKIIEITSPVFSDIKPESSGLVYYRIFPATAFNINLAYEFSKIFDPYRL